MEKKSSAKRRLARYVAEFCSWSRGENKIDVEVFNPKRVSILRLKYDKNESMPLIVGALAAEAVFEQATVQCEVEIDIDQRLYCIQVWEQEPGKYVLSGNSPVAVKSILESRRIG